MVIGFIGAGNMGGALASAAAKKKENRVLVYDIDSQKAQKLAETIGAQNCQKETLIKESDYIFLGVKPQVLETAIAPIKPDLENSGAVLISMAAGVSLQRLLSLVNMPAIRIMPNMPVGVGEGMTVYCADEKVTKDQIEKLVEAMSFSGKWDALEENDIDAATALSGCGPAFVFKFIKALIDAGVEIGLEPQKAEKYAVQTVVGAAKQLYAANNTPEELVRAVCSPGGSTIEGVKTLDNCDFERVVSSAVKSSFNRTKEMGKKDLDK